MCSCLILFRAMFSSCLIWLIHVCDACLVWLIHEVGGSGEGQVRDLTRRCAAAMQLLKIEMLYNRSYVLYITDHTLHIIYYILYVMYYT